MSLPQQDVEAYETPELSLASFLAFTLETMPLIIWADRKCTFTFPDKDPDHCATLAKMFRDGNTRVDAREFFFTCNNVRRAMHDARTFRTGR